MKTSFLHKFIKLFTRNYCHCKVYLLTCFLIFFLLQATHAQRKNAAKEWTTSDPFKTDVFIENYGQFNNWINSKDTVKYAINNSQKIFFLPTGIIYRLDIVEKEEEEKLNQIPVSNKEEEEEKC